MKQDAYKSMLMSVCGIDIQLQKKPIKNLHLRVVPPTGEVRVSAPLRMSHKSIVTFIESRIDWIAQKQFYFQSCPEKYRIRQYTTGETHYFLGQAYSLEVHEKSKKSGVVLAPEQILILNIRNTADTMRRQKLLDNWYREQLSLRIESRIDFWQKITKTSINEWRIKKMKTRWGTCNIQAKRIWLNLELVKKSPECLDYVIVHELTHLYERYHNAYFYSLMDKFFPDWRRVRHSLRTSPV